MVLLGLWCTASQEEVATMTDLVHVVVILLVTN